MKSNGWLSLSGMFFECLSYEHFYASLPLWNWFDGYAHNSAHALERNGWIRVSNGTVVNREVMPTQPQINALWDMYWESNNKSLLLWLERKLNAS